MTNPNKSGGEFPAFGSYKDGVKRNDLDIDEYIALVSNPATRKVLKTYKRTYTPGQDAHHRNPNTQADEVQNSNKFREMLADALESSHAEAFEKGDRNYLEGFIGTESDASDLDDDLVELFKLYETITERNEDTDKVGTNGLSKKWIIGGETRTGKNHTANKLFIEFMIIKYGRDKISIASNQTKLAKHYDFIHLVRDEQDIVDWMERTYKPMMGIILDEMDDPGRLNANNAHAVSENWVPVYNQLGKNGVQFVCYITHRFSALAPTVRGKEEGADADYYLYKPDKTNRGRLEIYENYYEEQGLKNEYITLDNLTKSNLKMGTTDAGKWQLSDGTSEEDEEQAKKRELRVQTETCNDCDKPASQFKNAPLNPILEVGYCWTHMPQEKQEEIREEIND